MAYKNKNKNRNHKKDSEKTPEEIKNVINIINSCDMLKNIDQKLLFRNDKDGLAYTVAEYTKKNISYSQLRKFFDAIRNIERKGDWNSMKGDFYLLKPRMAMSVGRNHIKKPFFDVISTAMDKIDLGNPIDKKDNFKTFAEFFESIVAYHKFLGGKD